MGQTSKLRSFNYSKNQNAWKHNKTYRLTVLFWVCFGLSLTGCVNDSNDSTSASVVVYSQFTDFGSVTIGQNVTRYVLISVDKGYLSNSEWLNTVTIRGNISITGEGFSIVSGGGDFSVNNWNESGPPNYAGAHVVAVKFQPSASGNFTGQLSITHNSKIGSNPEVSFLSGVGVASN